MKFNIDIIKNFDFENKKSFQSNLAEGRHKIHTKIYSSNENATVSSNYIDILFIK